MTEYFVRWKSKITEAEGRGTATFSQEQAEQIAEALNNEKGAICVHWASCYEPGQEGQS